MNIEFINPFLVAINEIYPDINLNREKLAKQNKHILIKGCASIIGVTGEIEGRVVIDMKLETALELACELLGDVHKTFDMEVSSSINEIANIGIYELY